MSETRKVAKHDSKVHLVGQAPPYQRWSPADIGGLRPHGGEVRTAAANHGSGQRADQIPGAWHHAAHHYFAAIVQLYYACLLMSGLRRMCRAKCDLTARAWYTR